MLRSAQIWYRPTKISVNVCWSHVWDFERTHTIVGILLIHLGHLYNSATWPFHPASSVLFCSKKLSYRKYANKSIRTFKIFAQGFMFYWILNIKYQSMSIWSNGLDRYSSVFNYKELVPNWIDIFKTTRINL